MSALILSNQDLCFGGYKLQSAINQLAVDTGADALDATTFGSAGNREFTGGLKSLGFSMGGFFQQAAGTGGIDAALMDAISIDDTVLTICPQNSTAGSPAKFFQGVETQYSLSGDIGSLLGFSCTAQNSDPAGLVHGTLMLSSITLAATGTSTGRQLGAVAAGKKIYAAAHVFSVAGSNTPTVTFTVQSDDNSGFTSATTRATFAAKTAIGAEWKEVAGAITDDYWRIGYTISGTNPVFGVMVSLGIK